MLPMSAELREKSRRYHDAARRAADAKTKRLLAGFALLLGQIAEVLERDGELPKWKLAQYQRLITLALSDRTERLVQALTVEISEEDRRKIKAWRMRAEELRRIADDFEVPSAQDTLRRLADTYDKLADDNEVRTVRHLTQPAEKAG